MEGVQPRYVAYCVAHCINHADVMMQRDKGLAFYRFRCWIMDRWYEWRMLFGKSSILTTKQDHADFDDWLFEQVSQ